MIHSKIKELTLKNMKITEYLVKQKHYLIAYTIKLSGMRWVCWESWNKMRVLVESFSPDDKGDGRDWVYHLFIYLFISARAIEW